MILVVAAVAAELGELPGEPLGVGPVAAAARMGRLLAERRPAGVVLVGSAGSYPGGPPVGAAVRAARVGFADGAAALGLGYVPLAPEPVRCSGGLLPGDLPAADVLTLAAITTDPALRDRLAQGWQVEHMEAYGAARACQDAGVPFAAVLGIANRVGPDAHAEWRANRARAEAAARAAVAEAIRA